MEKLVIHADPALLPEALLLLQQGTAEYELILPENRAASVLSQAAPDPRFALAEVAFGQPHPDAIAGASKLRWIHVSSSGITRYDTPKFRAQMMLRGIQVTNSASVYNEACAAQAMAFLLAQARLLPAGLASRAANGTPEWTALREGSRTLRDESILILGYGTIGKRLAEMLVPFGARVSAHRRQARGDEAVPIVAAEELPAALAAADQVVNILPESPETRGFFDAARFAGMKPGAVFHNIGRGATVDQDALFHALTTGPLAAAWLDVTDPEPLPDDHPLRSAANCHITPHTAGGHTGESLTLVRHFLENLARFTLGKPLLDRVM